MMTHYVQICLDPKEFQADGWHPWKNCQESPRETALLAVGKFMREGGYCDPRADFTTFDLHVYVATDKSPRHKNGRFMTCDGFVMKVSKQN